VLKKMSLAATATATSTLQLLRRWNSDVGPPARRISIGSAITWQARAIFQPMGTGGQLCRRHRSPGADSTRRLPDRKQATGRRHALSSSGLTIASAILDEPYVSADSKHQGLCSTPSIIVPMAGLHRARTESPNGESRMWGDYHARELALLLLREARAKNTSPSSVAFSLNNVAENLWSILRSMNRPVRSPRLLAGPDRLKAGPKQSVAPRTG